MNIGLIILFIGFALAYIVFQLVPLFYLVLTLDKKEREKMTIDDWLFFPLLLIMLLIPMAGAIIGLIFQDEDNEWVKRIALISVYIIIIGSVIFFGDKVRSNLKQSDMENRLNELAKRIHQDNVERGFYDEKRELGTLLMLIVSEVSEALEADRKGKHVNIHEIAEYANPDKFKEYVKDTFEDEIADTFIRLFDLVGYLGIDIEAHIGAKLAFNKTRGHKHGKKY